VKRAAALAGLRPGKVQGVSQCRSVALNSALR
jgi:hypothetical protein